MKHIAIVAGGTRTTTFLSDIKKHNIIIGVDRGAWWLIENGVVPAFSIGDFDSVTRGELKKIKEISPNVVQYDSEKNETDLELALQLAVSLKSTKISVYGGTGTRFDQTLAGILVLEQLGSIDVTFYDKTNEISLIWGQKHIFRSTLFPYCSFISLTKTAQVTLTGFLYPLKKGFLYRHKSVGISNEIVEKQAQVVVHKGIVLMVRSRG